MEHEWIDNGIAKAKAGDYVEAIAAFSEAIEANPISAIAYRQRGLAYYDAGRIHDAISDYTQAIKLHPKDFAAHYGRAIARLALKNYTGALSDIDVALRLNAQHAAGQRLRGTLCRKLNDIPEAIASFKQAAQLYLDRKDKENCQACLTAIAQIQSKSKLTPPPSPETSPTPTMPTVGDIYSELLDRIRHGHVQSALNDLNWVLQADDGDAQAHCCRGMAYLKLNQLENALKDFNRALQQQPENALALRNRGKVRFQLGDRAGGMADFERALQLNPEDILVYVAKGNAFRDIGDHQQAMAAYEQALSLDDQCASIYLNRAMAYIRLEETRQAIADYQTAVSLFCDAEDWENYNATLKKLNALQSGISSSTTSGQNPTSSSSRVSENVDSPRKERLRMLVGGHWEIAERLLEQARRYYPNQSETWYLDKVIQDLERNFET
ncbi:MAG: tetratricopeptide repeat protein [Sodalinema sp.]|uniref:tetratricopeptide repeat protein n=1 Tax=Sodalinema sp. TaxID=3080550 RepID=UPI00120CE029|nr:MAG: tetratricopeptide repeat protein [Phormidium sp. SL48-SHIP]